jgi:hypothetical protein
LDGDLVNLSGTDRKAVKQHPFSLIANAQVIDHKGLVKRFSTIAFTAAANLLISALRHH